MALLLGVLRGRELGYSALQACFPITKMDGPNKRRMRVRNDPKIEQACEDERDCVVLAVSGRPRTRI